jgi:hypothetical protein
MTRREQGRFSSFHVAAMKSESQWALSALVGRPSGAGVAQARCSVEQRISIWAVVGSTNVRSEGPSHSSEVA